MKKFILLLCAAISTYFGGIIMIQIYPDLQNAIMSLLGFVVTLGENTPDHDAGALIAVTILILGLWLFSLLLLYHEFKRTEAESPVEKPKLSKTPKHD